MKIIVVGGTGTIGKAVVNELKPRHEMIVVGHETGDLQVDLENTSSIEKLFNTVGAFDALISTTGKVHFGEMNQMTPEHYALGLNNKLMGQVNLVLIGSRFIADRGSFTLTSGILSQDPIRFGTSASMVNGALDSFVKAAAIELSRGIRINCVSPTVLTESLIAYGDYFRGFESVSAKRVAQAFSKSVEGLQTGQIYSVS
ncbi:MAG: short chain dehydrogenase [Gammaproteobacteria bacterium]|nr:short chain dehydrogenase [Gammaproteobacteria bacterium]